MKFVDARSVPLLVSLGDLHLAFTFILLMLVAIETRFNSFEVLDHTFAIPISYFKRTILILGEITLIIIRN